MAAFSIVCPKIPNLSKSFVHFLTTYNLTNSVEVILCSFLVLFKSAKLYLFYHLCK